MYLTSEIALTLKSNVLFIRSSFLLAMKAAHALCMAFAFSWSTKDWTFMYNIGRLSDIYLEGVDYNQKTERGKNQQHFHDCF